MCPSRSWPKALVGAGWGAYHGRVQRDAVAPDGWLAAAEELEAYEGLRQGDLAAFRAIAEPLNPALIRLARLTARDLSDPPDVVLRSWDLALGGLDMFRWQTPFATWIAGITVTLGRSRAAPDPPLPHASPEPPPRSLGSSAPDDWSDLPWGPRWEHAWPVLRSVLDTMPGDRREVLHCRDAEGWPQRRTCDVLGLTEEACSRLLAEGRAEIRDALAALVVEHRRHDGQLAAVRRMLAETLDRSAVPLDPRVIDAFRRWHAARQRGWQRLFGRVLQPLRG
jgi:DNA-directed RNA polymerase specialized sigma24 family protein